MDNILEYKGYISKVVYDVHLKRIRGVKIKEISDSVEFICDDLTKVEDVFQQAVNEQIERKQFEKERAKNGYRESITVRMDPSIYNSMVIYAEKNDITLNLAVERAVQFFVKNANCKMNTE